MNDVTRLSPLADCDESDVRRNTPTRPRLWTRRGWVSRNVAAMVVSVPVSHVTVRLARQKNTSNRVASYGCSLARHEQLSPLSTRDTVDDREALVRHAVDAAKRAGARYADARLTRMVRHGYRFNDNGVEEIEHVGVGVRALVNGYWGFAACPSGDKNAVEQLARQAVAQAAVNARGAVPQIVDMGEIPVAVGRWSTPVAIDPFTIPIEEKVAFMRYWVQCAKDNGLAVDGIQSDLHFIQEERIVATSEGGCFTQTVFESGGRIMIRSIATNQGSSSGLSGLFGGPELAIQGIDSMGRGWEMFIDAKIPDQLQAMPEKFAALAAVAAVSRPATIGRYTVVCDAVTMATLLNATLGAAIQIDRALGYEANARGTSFLDDPFHMLGAFKVGSPLVNVTANRSAPAQLATVKWDDEGVIPQDMQLVKDGVLTDFQTTRQQAAWLADYYKKVGRPVRSNGCAAAESALTITMQRMPNLSLEAGASSIRLDDLVADVKDGILIERGSVQQMDFQARNGLVVSDSMRKIQNGRLGAVLESGALQFNTLELWRNVIAVGGASTRVVVPVSQYGTSDQYEWGLMLRPIKGEPPQATSHSVQAVAATIANQPIINPRSKA